MKKTTKNSSPKSIYAKAASGKSHDNSTSSLAIEKNPSQNGYNWSKMAELLRNSTCRSIERFYLNMGIPRKTYYEAIERDANMKAAHEYTLERIACDREEMALDKNLGMNSLAAHSLSQYSERWKKDVEWRTELKNKEEQDKKQNITVIMEPFKRDK